MSFVSLGAHLTTRIMMTDVNSIFSTAQISNWHGVRTCACWCDVKKHSMRTHSSASYTSLTNIHCWKLVIPCSLHWYSKGGLAIAPGPVPCHSIVTLSSFTVIPSLIRWTQQSSIVPVSSKEECLLSVAYVLITGLMGFLYTLLLTYVEPPNKCHNSIIG